MMIEIIFDETLVAWGGQKFDFKAYVKDDNNMILRYNPDGECTGEREAKQNYIPTKIGTMFITLEVC